MNCRARPYKPEDREGVRRVCCETGFMGDPVDPLFGDRELFADFFTGYYTDCEPEHCVVGEADGRVVGYVICCVDDDLYRRRQVGMVLSAIPKVMGRVLRGKYRMQDLRFLSWFVLRASRETPRVPPEAAHFHFNILPRWRDGHLIRRMFFPFLRKLPEWGVKRVYGQMQIYPDRRAQKLFERFGFYFYDQREITKFRRFGKEGVSVATIVHEVPQP